MWPASRQPRLVIAALLGAVVLAGCDKDAADGRPPAKPETMTARIPAAGSDQMQLARISTKSGEILILEEDGSVTTMDLGSSEGRDAFEVTEADLMALNANLDLNLGGSDSMVSLPGRPPRMTAQERALKEFAARTKPTLPAWAEGTEIVPEDFLGVTVSALNADGKADLVEVTANLRRGVDADIAFSYATCALAGWAKENGSEYGRHIRTLQDTRDGKLLIGAAFLLSDSKPLGLRVMETEDTLRECRARGIPAA
ncbi:hypothetical protein JJJ17_05630 [Paracoccus caeni]|uniref:Lipoprotein n=1 Tax=Paracoccus caeni TaxID=657651 RepID=A0A934VZK8_9RHOB|nr:hypothetical protein [Paracoccus caeni]MBK4215403.1 hypothetical protein [Paracoccus caeni]